MWYLVFDDKKIRVLVFQYERIQEFCFKFGFWSLVQVKSSSQRLLLKFSNQIEMDFPPKGQLISKGLFAIFTWKLNQKTNEKFLP